MLKFVGVIGVGIGIGIGIGIGVDEAFPFTLILHFKVFFQLLP